MICICSSQLVRLVLFGMPQRTHRSLSRTYTLRNILGVVSAPLYFFLLSLRHGSPNPAYATGEGMSPVEVENNKPRDVN